MFISIPVYLIEGKYKRPKEEDGVYISMTKSISLYNERNDKRKGICGKRKEVQAQCLDEHTLPCLQESDILGNVQPSGSCLVCKLGI